MKNSLLISATILLIISSYWSAPVCAQISSYTGAPGAAIGLIQMIAAQKKANDVIAARTTTTITYHGQRFLMKRSPEDVIAGDAADRITQLESQLSLCYTALLADSTGLTCPPAQQAAIRENLKYIGLARPGWHLQPYREEFKFYLAEDKRRQRAAK